MFKLLTKKKGEKGQALILVLAMIAVGSLLIVSLLGFINTGTNDLFTTQA